MSAKQRKRMELFGQCIGKHLKRLLSQRSNKRTPGKVVEIAANANRLNTLWKLITLEAMTLNNR